MNELGMRITDHNLVIVTREAILKTNMVEHAWDVYILGRSPCNNPTFFFFFFSLDYLSHMKSSSLTIGDHIVT